MDYKIAARSHEFNRKKDSISSLINKSTINSFEAGYEYCQKEYEEKLRWIPVEEKLPEKYKEVLLRGEGNLFSVGWLNDYNGFTVDGDLEPLFWRSIL